MTVLWLFRSVAVSKPRSSFARDDRVCRFNAVQVCDGCHNGALLSQFGTGGTPRRTVVKLTNIHLRCGGGARLLRTRRTSNLDGGELGRPRTVRGGGGRG